MARTVQAARPWPPARVRPAWGVPALAPPAAVAGVALLAASGWLPAPADEAWLLTVLPLAAVAGATCCSGRQAPARPPAAGRGGRVGGGRAQQQLGPARPRPPRPVARRRPRSGPGARVGRLRGRPSPAAQRARRPCMGGRLWALTAVPPVGLLLPDCRLPRRWRVVGFTALPRRCGRSRQGSSAGRIIEAPAREGPRAPDVLTPRERDVRALVAQELSNDDITERLVLSTKTVATTSRTSTSSSASPAGRG